MKKLVSQEELADILGVSVLTLYRQRKRGMPYSRIGRQIRYDPDAVEMWMNATETEKENEHGKDK